MTERQLSKGFLSFIKRAEADIVAEATRAEEEAKARETEANAKASEVSAESEGVKTDAVKKILKSQKSIKKSEKLERKLSTRANALSGEKAAEVMKEIDRVKSEREVEEAKICLLYTSPSPRDGLLSRMPSSA